MLTCKVFPAAAAAQRAEYRQGVAQTRGSSAELGTATVRLAMQGGSRSFQARRQKTWGALSENSPPLKKASRRLDEAVSNKELHPYRRADRSCVLSANFSLLAGYMAARKEVLWYRGQRLLFTSNGIGNIKLV
jgi:hypothetical protein